MRGYVEHHQFRFPVAVDPDWQILKRWARRPRALSWTSVSFLLDRCAVYASRAPGRQAGATPDPDDSRVMRTKIEALLAEDP